MRNFFEIDPSEVGKNVEDLQQAVADIYALYFMTLSGHWNMECKNFISIHEMLEEQYEEHAKTGDALAERIRAMGYKVPISFNVFAERSTLRPFSEEAGWEEMVKKLAESNESVFISLSKLSKQAEKSGDDGLVDLLGGTIRKHESFAWKLRSHLK